MTIRVNDVDGVGGFVLPGDHVDIGLTRQVDKTNATNEVVLQNVRVLAIDQIADERLEKPAVVKAVTLEVDVIGAQKLALASAVGNLSLVLRKAGATNADYARRITLSDLGTPSTPLAQLPKGAGGIATVTVTRAATKQEYSVPVEHTDLQASNKAGP
jgi:pilus assembly protein CpaB